MGTKQTRPQAHARTVLPAARMEKKQGHCSFWLASPSDWDPAGVSTRLRLNQERPDKLKAAARKRDSGSVLNSAIIDHVIIHRVVVPPVRLYI